MDPWAEFLRRVLLSASLAGVGGITSATAGERDPASAVAEAEPRPEPPPAEVPQR